MYEKNWGVLLLSTFFIDFLFIAYRMKICQYNGFHSIDEYNGLQWCFIFRFWIPAKTKPGIPSLKTLKKSLFYSEFPPCFHFKRPSQYHNFRAFDPNEGLHALNPGNSTGSPHFRPHLHQISSHSPLILSSEGPSISWLFTLSSPEFPEP